MLHAVSCCQSTNAEAQVHPWQPQGDGEECASEVYTAIPGRFGHTLLGCHQGLLGIYYACYIGII